MLGAYGKLLRRAHDAPDDVLHFLPIDRSDLEPGLLGLGAEFGVGRAVSLIGEVSDPPFCSIRRFFDFVRKNARERGLWNIYLGSLTSLFPLTSGSPFPVT
jgi:hypothetical protein